jgi:peptidoglycan/xylan/chitin deacetylase (PgdA/CDA1 family)
VRAALVFNGRNVVYDYRSRKATVPMRKATTTQCLFSLPLVVACGTGHDTIRGSSTGGASTGNNSTGGEGGAPESAQGEQGGGSGVGGTMPSGGTSSLIVQCALPTAGSPSVAKPSGTPGNLRVLDWAGYKGAITYTFDDANSSQISNYAILNALGVRMTFYLTTGKTDASNSIWSQALLDGHELGNHTKNHFRNGSATDIDSATTFIEGTFGVKPWTMAAPYGDASYVPLAETRFLVNRGVTNALVLPNDTSDPFNLPCYVPPQSGTAVDDFNPQVDSAQLAGGWRIMLVHGFAGGTDSAYLPVSIDEFTTGVNHAKSLGNLWIDSMVNIAAYWRGQKTLSASTPAILGSDTKWTWRLPANFPPGKCLRITVDGGTLTQNGTVLEWDDRGYYEISLDAGSLTLSP